MKKWLLSIMMWLVACSMVGAQGSQEATISYYLTSDSRLEASGSVQVEAWAWIAPQITFQLIGLPEGTAACGLTNQHTTTGLLADFGTINSTTFTDIMQRLEVRLNVDGGYSVTAIQDDQMRLQGGSAITCVSDGMGNDACLPDSQRAGISPTNQVTWGNVSSGAGLGFTLQNVQGGDNVFDYTQGYRIFADAQKADTPVVIIETANGRISNNNVCYRLAARSSNMVGTYANNLTYTLTAKF